ncbi:MAG: carboxypeptidase regulatory-like domain-containing protein, partial [Vicinamibacteria bacterium]
MRERSRRANLLVAICGGVTIAWLPPAAPAQTLTGSIFGTVNDSSGGRLPGVTVTVTSPQLIRGRETRVTSDQGAYRVPSLPPGTYVVTFELSGFQTMKREGILLLAGQSLAVDAHLELAQIQEAVTVSGEAPLVDTRSSALVNVSDTDTLENVPVTRELTKLLNIMPGVTDGRYEFAPVNTVHGGTVRQNLYTLDGVNVNDPVQNTTAILLPVDAFQEIQITTAGITAEFGDASGALVNYVTKSGGNDFDGGVNLYYQGEGTESDNVTDELRQQGLSSSGGFDHVYDAGVLLGGPIRENRAWFFTNLRYFDSAFRRPDFRGPIATDEKHWFTKPTIQLTDSSRLDVGVFFRDALEFPFGAASTFRNSADDRTWDGNSKQNIIVNPRWTNMLSDSTLVDARASFSIYKILGENPNNDGSPAYMDVATGIISGGSAQADGDNRRNRHEVKVDLSHFLEEGPGGSHSLKTGFSWGITPVWYTQFLKGARGDNVLELAGCTRECISSIPDTHHLL